MVINTYYVIDSVVIKTMTIKESRKLLS